MNVFWILWATAFHDWLKHLELTKLEWLHSVKVFGFLSEILDFPTKIAFSMCGIIYVFLQTPTTSVCVEWVLESGKFSTSIWKPTCWNRLITVDNVMNIIITLSICFNKLVSRYFWKINVIPYWFFPVANFYRQFNAIGPLFVHYAFLPYILSTSFSTHPKPLTWDKKPFQNRRVPLTTFLTLWDFPIFSAMWDCSNFSFFPKIF